MKSIFTFLCISTILVGTAHAFLPSTIRHRNSVQLHSAPFVRSFLGKGPEAVVRNGVVLISPAEEFHHFYRQAAIYIYTMGEAEDGSDYLIRGLILDHPTAFSVEESMPNAPQALSENRIFRGGDRGGEGIILLHAHADWNVEEIGSSGVYQGGWDAALKANEVDENSCKVFFNYCEFTEAELDGMLGMEREDGDAWMSLEVDPTFVLDESYGRGDAWKRLRNAVLQLSVD